jgi:uncharacterized protein (TIGR02266 family)
VIAAPPAIAPVPETAAAVAPPPSSRRESRAPGSRKHERLPFEINVTIVSEHNFFAGLSLNISEGGLFVATHHSHKVGTRLEIKLLLPGDDDPITMMTEVRWVRLLNEDSDQGPGLGLKFVDLPDDVHAKITRFVKSRDPLYFEDD